jgi:hypothetical protein
MLENHLCQATNMLPKSMRDDDLITEPVLCMAGKKCSRTSMLFKPDATSPEDQVLLRPTVWIHCGSKKCKKKVMDAVRQLNYLNRFLSKLDMEPPHVSLHAPWPAADEYLAQSPLLTENLDEFSFAIEDSNSTLRTICGTRARCTFRTPHGIVERYSTIGGLIVVKDSLFALTTAHTIVSCRADSFSSFFVRKTESTNNTSSDTSSGCETSSDSEGDSSTDNPLPLPAPLTSTRRSANSREPHETIEGTWMNLQLPKILAYMNRGTIDGDYSFPISAPRTSDFALIDLGSVLELSNGYRNQDENTVETISGHIPTCELLSGDVWIITSSSNAPRKGYMLDGDASVILRGTIMRTKKIQVVTTNGMSITHQIH